ncbi:MAG: N,N'-diacetylchitobiose phosphorylase, partial [Clostridia bacterium]|nr:N,N'-diacetylchitobiose phosphorylase [Clostridia bacterium]
MRYGYFDDVAREYVIDRVDVPFSMTNYLGTQRMGAVVSHNAGGYCWLDSPQYHRITRFRPNGVPMDFPGHYVYLRDDESGNYWSVSWQPTGIPLNEAKYICRHGLSYSVYECETQGIAASQTLFIPRESENADPVEIFDVRVKNTSDRQRHISVTGYVEFSFHSIDIDNQNFQMSLYCAGSFMENDAAICELHYEPDSFQFFAASFIPDGWEGTREAFIGPYRTERNPIGVERGALTGSHENGGNPVGALMKRLVLAPGEEARLLFYLGTGRGQAAVEARRRYDFAGADRAFGDLRRFWDEKLDTLTVHTPHANMNRSLNIWNLYQSEINVLFSRFASFIEVGGRTGLGFRDTAQDAMCIPHAEPEGCKMRILQLLNGVTTAGYGLHLFDPAWFEGKDEEKEWSPTVVPTAEGAKHIHGLKDACADDALWLIPAIVEYARETGDTGFL